jgi:hypothetical protein
MSDALAQCLPALLRINLAAYALWVLPPLAMVLPGRIVTLERAETL